MPQRKKIGIVGYGYVGKAMHRFFENHYEVRIYDPLLTRERSPLASTQAAVNECETAVVCVPTPSGTDGRCDTTAVEATIGWLETPHILLKSTVPVGTTDRLREATGKSIVFSPEYCGESSYWSPYAFHTEVKETPFFTFGGPPEETSKMVALYLPVTGPVKVYRQTTAKAAEMAKYMANTFFATKITFFYELAGICHALGIDYHEVRELFLLDPRINPMHTGVFEANFRPFSGKCLPKDLSALIACAEQAGYEPELLSEVRRSNDRIAKLRERSHAPTPKLGRKARKAA
jgi:nucleotide sugar dehydrogenase